MNGRTYLPVLACRLLDSAALNTHVSTTCCRRPCRSRDGPRAAVAKALRQQRPFETDSTTLQSRTTGATRQPGIVKTREGHCQVAESETAGQQA
jgi:hypothetical protein